MLKPANIRARLAEHEPERFAVKRDTRQAAVAVIIRAAENGSDILFIQRAEKAGDPWSGHMAFPGGHREPTDADLKSAAIRETDEEIGLDLRPAAYLGELDQQRATPRGRPLNMLVAPYVFEIAGDPVFRPNYEVAEVVWTPLANLFHAKNHTVENKMVGDTPTNFNGYRLERGHFVWGMTYRMLQTFFEILDPSYERPDID